MVVVIVVIVVVVVVVAAAAVASSIDNITSFTSSHIKCSCNCTMVLIDCWGHTEVVCHTLEVCMASLSCVDGL